MITPLKTLALLSTPILKEKPRMSDEPTVEIFVEVKAKKAEGAEAFLVSDGSVEAWIPYSLLQEGSELGDTSERGDEGIIVIPQWKAEEEGLI